MFDKKGKLQQDITKYNKIKLQHDYITRLQYVGVVREVVVLMA